jgi:hypothetical protein
MLLVCIHLPLDRCHLNQQDQQHQQQTAKYLMVKFNPQAKTLAETLAEINSQQDQNAGRRASAINSCLASMGYQYTTIGGQSGYGNQAFIDSWERQQAVKRAARTLVSEKQTDRERTCYYNINGNQVVRTVPISRDCPWQPEGEIKENYVSQNGIKQESTTGGLQDYHKILVKGVQNTSGLWDCYYGRNLVLTSQNECPQRLP